MAQIRMWETLPGSDLASRANWKSLGGGRYAVLRARVLIVQTNGSESRFGPVVHAVNVAPNDSVTFRSKRSRVISQTTTITEGIRFATTSRVCEKLAAKVSAELGGKLAGFAGKLSTELLASSEYEITSTLETSLSTTASYTIQDTVEEEVVNTLTGSSESRVAELRRRYWPRRWDIYLHSYDYLELSYKKSWFWPDVRKTMKETSSGALAWPLGSIIFYEPQPGLDVCYNVTDELDNEDGILSESTSTPMPRSVVPESETLEDLAELAFPVTREEISRASRWPKRAAPKKAARAPDSQKKRVSAKKGAAKKAMPRKASPKKAMSRNPRRKSAPRGRY
jgi:hypothetical protein